MSNRLTDDFEFAQRLHEELNRSTIATEQPVIFDEEPANKKLRSEASIIDISSESEDENYFTLKPPTSNHRSCSPLQESSGNRANTALRTSPKEYFIPEMNSYVNLDDNSDWALVNMETNVQQMFDKLKDQYFKVWLIDVKWDVQWDKTGIITDGSNFKMIENLNGIIVATCAMTRPRIQLVSVLLHALIHIYLNVSTKGTVPVRSHDDNFREIMLFLNQTLKTQITTSHKFAYTPEEADYHKCWYKCVGLCSAYEPFHGVVHCKTIPNQSHAFWKNHEEDCGGQYFRIFEICRFNRETDSDEKKYVRNVKYMFPKQPEGATKSKNGTRTKIQVRELFDLTEDEGPEAKVINLCDVIDLDSSEFNVGEKLASSCNAFTKQVSDNFKTCPFCHKALDRLSKFESHVDSCRGYQQKVEFNMKRTKKPLIKSQSPSTSNFPSLKFDL